MGYGFDFDNDGKISFEEKHLTYHIERETAQKNSGNYTPRRDSTRHQSGNSIYSRCRGTGIDVVIWVLTAIGLVYFIVNIVKLFIA